LESPENSGRFKLLIERGLARRENSAAREAAGASIAGLPQAHAAHITGTDSPPAKAKPIHNAKLCQRLTAHRTAALHAELVM
jgi:ParB family chromosome partitioning protein